MRRLLLMFIVLLASIQLMAQGRSVSGKVTDANGNPLPNASVQVKNTATGTVTNSEGNFSLVLPANARTLVFSYADMTLQEVNIGTETQFNVALKPSEKTMQEVVIVGYGVQRKKDQTGSISTINGQEMENRPFTSFDKMLQGEVPGLLSVAGSGQPGATQNVRLRGIGSISAGSAPLYVVDGVPVVPGDISRLTTTANTFAGINPNDIEKVYRF